MKGFSRSQRRLSSRRPDAIAEERNARERMSNNSYLNFDGVTSYMEIAYSPDFGAATTGALTVSACIRPRH